MKIKEMRLKLRKRLMSVNLFCKVHLSYLAVLNIFRGHGLIVNASFINGRIRITKHTIISNCNIIGTTIDSQEDKELIHIIGQNGEKYVI